MDIIIHHSTFKVSVNGVSYLVTEIPKKIWESLPHEIEVELLFPSLDYGIHQEIEKKVDGAGNDN